MFCYNFPQSNPIHPSKFKIYISLSKLSETLNLLRYLCFTFLPCLKAAHLSAFQAWTPENKIVLMSFQIPLPTLNICPPSSSSTCHPVLRCLSWTGCPQSGRMSGAWQGRTFPETLGLLCHRKLQLRQRVCPHTLSRLEFMWSVEAGSFGLKGRRRDNFAHFNFHPSTGGLDTNYSAQTRESYYYWWKCAHFYCLFSLFCIHFAHFPPNTSKVLYKTHI